MIVTVKKKTNLQAARERMGLSQQEFAEACDVKRGVIQYWEARSHDPGERVPNTKYALKVADFADLSMEDLFEDFGVQRQPRGKAVLIA